jgi:hypothetical protein
MNVRIRKLLNMFELLRRLLGGPPTLLRLVGSRRGACPALIAGLLALGACATERGGPISYEVPATFARPDAPRAASVGGDYRIATGDTLSVTVYQVEALSKDYRVDLAGNVSVPRGWSP